MSDAGRPDLGSRLALAREAGREAAALTLRYFRRPGLGVEEKADGSPVTRADREAEALLRRAIGDAFPDDGILGEEAGETPGASGFRWILDPIDGTKSFIHGVPLFGTLIGVEHEGRSVVGALILPALGEAIHAAAGGGAWLTRGSGAPEPARVSGVDDLARAVVCATSVNGFAATGRREAWERLRAAAAFDRGWGDCFGYALVATGRAEVMIDPRMMVWDCAALQPILEEAGGTFTDWSGHPTIHAPATVATNGRLLEPVLELLR